MQIRNALVVACLTLPLAAHAMRLDSRHPSEPSGGEQLGTVSFEVSCSPQVRAQFNRGVALLHDFWYEEAQRQFENIAKADPKCAMAHWGIAMSVFHQIWDRPDEQAIATGNQEMQAAKAQPAKTARERGYIGALDGFFQRNKMDYQARIERYSAAMAGLYARYPHDTDAGAFYALSLLAAEAPNDTSLTQEHKALAVLKPLFAKSPNHPGVVHYTIHACDTPSLAADGLAAANRYGEVASSGPHAVHMPGHIFARLGMWRADIDSNAASISASHAAEARHQSGAMDQFHSDDFLLYAYLQSGEDARAKQVLADSAAALAHFETMPAMGERYMTGMFPYYRSKLPIFYHLEMRDWKAAAVLEPVAGAPPETQTLTYWARTIASGHLHQAKQARADFAAYQSLMDKVKRGRHAYYADSTSAQIGRSEMLGWVAFADKDMAGAVTHMREAADLQDKLGQGEVDIPAREMLADMLLESNQPQQALVEYRQALQLSPNRFNGLFNAGMAAEAAGDMTTAKQYYSQLLTSTGNGSRTSRPELDHVKAFMSSPALAVN